MATFDADRQIEQMSAFIMQEAREKSEELRLKTEKEFMAEKLSLEKQRSQEIRSEEEKKRKNYYVQKKIEKSKKLTAARFDTMKKRDDKINELKQDIKLRLAEVAKSSNYKELIRFLIAQGLLTIQEAHVTLQCRKEDLSIVKGEVHAAIKLFQSTVANVTEGFIPPVEITVSENDFLAPAPVKGSSAASCSGGVLLSCRGGQIICRNTLDSRLDLAFEGLKPQIRGVLFGVREKFESRAPSSRHGVSGPR